MSDNLNAKVAGRIWGAAKIWIDDDGDVWAHCASGPGIVRCEAFIEVWDAKEAER